MVRPYNLLESDQQATVLDLVLMRCEARQVNPESFTAQEAGAEVERALQFLGHLYFPGKDVDPVRTRCLAQIELWRRCLTGKGW